jgi:GNAT superfamily N-acetyltransferase
MSRPVFVVVAETANGQIVGFASGGPERTRHLLYRGELSAVYLLLEYQHRGIGRRLVSAVAARLDSDGFATMMLWVLAKNPACRFYEALGGRRIMSKTVSEGGIELEEVAYGWDSLAGLLK